MAQVSRISRVIQRSLCCAEQMERFSLLLLLLFMSIIGCCGYNAAVLTRNNSIVFPEASGPQALNQSTSPGQQLPSGGPGQQTSSSTTPQVPASAGGYPPGQQPPSGVPGQSILPGTTPQVPVNAPGQQPPSGDLGQPPSPGGPPVTNNHAYTFVPYLYAEPSSSSFSPNQIVQAAQRTSTKNYILSFIISSGCQAIWGDSTKAGLPPAGSSSGTADPIMAAISQLRQMGGDIIISFGGANGTELGQACTDVSSLQKQYQNIIDTYKVTHLDFDIDSAAAVGDTPSVDRRNKALAALEQANSNLIISYTLPVNPTGLTDGDVKLLRNAVDNKVKVSLVNIMTMDYGHPDTHMGQNAISAAQATQKQVASTGLSAKIGITPMIGQNDSQGEIFSLDDARSLVAFAKQNSYVSTLSMWSLGRDKPCDTGAGGSASATCSSISQKQYDFMKILGG